MLIGFIGCPSSGKTTTAAMTFADLKNMGISSEFVPEQARLYIAAKRLHLDQPPGSPVKLTDDDQVEIIVSQKNAEQLMVKSCGPGTLVVTDSSIFNTLLYMSQEERDLGDKWNREHLPRYDLLFYCAPVKMPANLDPNRIHNEQQSLEIDKLIPELLKVYGLKPIFLTGDAKQRHHVVTRTILEKLAS